jgi:hypothetical protein
LQVPSIPQGSLEAGHTPCGSAALAAVTAMQVPVVLAACPFRAAVHALQPVHSLSQHTPSAMIPEVHSTGWVAALPLGFLATQTLAVVSQ